MHNHSLHPSYSQEMVINIPNQQQNLSLNEIYLTKSDEVVLVKNPSISSRKNKKKFDAAFHRRLEQHFPDWQGRIDSQRKQDLSRR